MPRIAEARIPAEPSTKLQREKYERMLKVAAELGAANRFERVQMNDVAKSAGIAIGTLYRYFPSKTHLFIGVMAAQIDGLRAQSSNLRRDHLSPPESVAQMLTGALRALMRQPWLADAMIRSLNIGHLGNVLDVAKIDEAFNETMWTAARIDQPTESDERLARLVNQQWFGMVQSCLNGHLTLETAEGDVLLACELLLGDLSSSRQWRAEGGGGVHRARVAPETDSGIRSRK